MRNRILSIVIACSALVMLPIMSANAQTRGKIKAEIPFEFVAGSKVLSAGTYTIERLAYNNPEKLVIRSADNQTTALLAVNRVPLSKSPTETDLVFNKVGDTYFLRDIKVEGITLGSQLPKTKNEKHMEHSELAAGEAVIIHAETRGF